MSRVLVYVCRTGEGDITASAQFVHSRNRNSGQESHLFHVDPYQEHFPFTVAQLQTLSAMNSYSRLYLYGHVDWQQQKMEQRDAAWYARILMDVPKIDRVSIIGCMAGRDLEAPKGQLLNVQSVNSFASRLHAQLKGRSDVWARLLDVKIDTNGQRTTLIEKAKGEIGVAKKRQYTKVRFTWEGRRQVRYYAGKEKAYPAGHLTRNNGVTEFDI